MIRSFAVFAVLLAAAPAAGAESGGRGSSPASLPADETPPATAGYCSSVADAAADARYARQVAALDEIEKRIEQKTAALEAKRREYEDWLERREAFLKKADEGAVAIYAQMRADAAAAQMMAMDQFVAVALLAKLPPRTASAILSEMDPAKGAQLTNTMAGLSSRNTGKEPTQ